MLTRREGAIRDRLLTEIAAGERRLTGIIKLDGRFRAASSAYRLSSPTHRRHLAVTTGCSKAVECPLGCKPRQIFTPHASRQPRPQLEWASIPEVLRPIKTQQRRQRAFRNLDRRHLRPGLLGERAVDQPRALGTASEDRASRSHIGHRGGYRGLAPAVDPGHGAAPHADLMQQRDEAPRRHRRVFDRPGRYGLTRHQRGHHLAGKDRQRGSSPRSTWRIVDASGAASEHSCPREPPCRTGDLLDAQRLVPLGHALAAREGTHLRAGPPASRWPGRRWWCLRSRPSAPTRCRHSRDSCAACQHCSVSVSVPRWLGLSSTVLAAPAAAAWRSSAASDTRKSSPTTCIRSPTAAVKRAKAAGSSSASGSSMLAIGKPLDTSAAAARSGRRCRARAARARACSGRRGRSRWRRCRARWPPVRRAR